MWARPLKWHWLPAADVHHDYHKTRHGIQHAILHVRLKYLRKRRQKYASFSTRVGLKSMTISRRRNPVELRHVRILSALFSTRCSILLCTLCSESRRSNVHLCQICVSYTNVHSRPRGRGRATMTAPQSLVQHVLLSVYPQVTPICHWKERTKSLSKNLPRVENPNSFINRPSVCRS